MCHCVCKCICVCVRVYVLKGVLNFKITRDYNGFAGRKVLYMLVFTYFSSLHVFGPI